MLLSSGLTYGFVMVLLLLASLYPVFMDAR
jgi:hypothetical protein